MAQSPGPTELRDIPAANVGPTVQQLVDSGASKIECTDQGNGKWTIRAS
jgi:hypothetical protein